MLQQQGILGSSQLNTSKQVAKSMNDSIATDSEVTWFADFFLSVSIDDISENDANIAFYISGHIGRSITRRRKCSSCKTTLVKSEDISPPPQCEPNENAKFFKLAILGGLFISTKFCFVISSLAVQYYIAMINDDVAKKKIMTFRNQQSAFVAAVKVMVQKSNFSAAIFKLCLASHYNFELILKIVFNCFAKNELKRLNTPKEEPQLRSRKMRKLNSGSSVNIHSRIDFCLTNFLCIYLILVLFCVFNNSCTTETP